MTLKRAKAHMKTRRKKYVVGYTGAGNTLFAYVGSAHEPSVLGRSMHACLYPMSLTQARAFLKTMPCAGACIFALVPVAVNR